MSRLDFVILYCVAMIVFGLVASVFYPEQYSFGREDIIVSGGEVTDLNEEGSWLKWLGAIGGFIDGITNVFKFIWACMSFNIPYCPEVIRLILVAPFHAGMLYIIITTIRGN